jgi:hypothetical protein
MAKKVLTAGAARESTGEVVTTIGERAEATRAGAGTERTTEESEGRAIQIEDRARVAEVGIEGAARIDLALTTSSLDSSSQLGMS